MQTQSLKLKKLFQMNDSLSKRGIALEDVELTKFKWEALHPESSRPAVDSDRCLKKGMGSNM